MYLFECAHVHAYMYIYIIMHAYINTCVHLCMYICTTFFFGSYSFPLFLKKNYTLSLCLSFERYLSIYLFYILASSA